jgi:hypothetical protein
LCFLRCPARMERLTMLVDADGNAPSPCVTG